tara:strand:+ start:5712 stop:6029 length:318 start_codon:yes stop_codon:yes gene_type:complete
MAYSIFIKDIEDLENRIKSKDKKLSIEIANSILDNLDTKKRFINILEIHLENSGMVVDITADRKNFIHTLQKNLNTLIFHEEYEMCAKVKTAIEYLKQHAEDLAP